MLPTSSTSEPVALPRQWMQRLFDRMAAMYGAKFAEQWRSLDQATMLATWSQALAGYSAEEIRRGLDACLMRDWPPTLPEFLKLCRPPMDPVRLWYEAQQAAKERDEGKPGAWPAPFVFHAYRDMAWEVRSGEYAKHGERWRLALDRAKAAVERGELPNEVPLPAERLPEPAPLTRAQAAERAKAINVQIPARPRGIDLAWAYALRERHERGERLTMTQIEMYRQALRHAPHPETQP